MLELNHDAVWLHAAHEAFYSHILTLKCGDKTERVVLKEIQRHPAKPKILHLDFQRVTDNTRIRMTVPLHFVGAESSPGVKQSGGLVVHMMNTVEVNCLAKDLPEFIEVDLSGLQLGHPLHLSDIKLPQGVDITVLAQGAEHDMPIATVQIPAALVEEAPVAAAAGIAEGAAAPAATTPTPGGAAS
jgi:large subunit ribosomal protein L25